MKNPSRFCDGIKRRNFLQLGAAGAFGMGVSLPQLLQSQALGHDQNRTIKDVSLIVVFLQGGLSTIDTWDMKPEAPTEFRGEFSPISTAVPGIQICEHLPQIAKHQDKFSLVRSFGHGDSNPGSAYHAMLTGYKPAAGFNGGLKPNSMGGLSGPRVATATPPFR